MTEPAVGENAAECINGAGDIYISNNSQIKKLKLIRLVLGGGGDGSVGQWRGGMQFN